MCVVTSDYLETPVGHCCLDTDQSCLTQLTHVDRLTPMCFSWKIWWARCVWASTLIIWLRFCFTFSNIALVHKKSIHQRLFWWCKFMDSSQEYESGCDHWIPGPSLQNTSSSCNTFTMRIRHWISGFLTHIFLLMTTVLKYINMYIEYHDNRSCKPKLLWTIMVAERLSTNHGKRGDKNQAVQRWVPQYSSCIFLLQYPVVYSVKRWALPLPDHKCNRHVTSSV
jgi:hypothetical protein